ncbi:hypothetical protein BJ546DRAFT_948168 [Cryomyces antarcticus]
MSTTTPAGPMGLAAKPLKVEEIVKRAQDFDYNALIPMRYWLRTADTLQKEAVQAGIYEREGNDQQAYLLLFRHAQLVLSNLSAHPQAQQHENRLALAEARKAVDKNLAKLEVLKPRINQRYAKYEEAFRLWNARREEAAQQRDDEFDGNRTTKEMGRMSLHDASFSHPALDGLPQTIEAGTNQGLAVQLAHREIKRRDTARKATRKSDVSIENGRGRRTEGLWADWEQELAQDEQDTDDITHSIIETRRRVDEPKAARGTRRTDGKTFSTPASYSYPSVPAKSDRGSWSETAKPVPPPYIANVAEQSSSRGALRPARPPKDALELPATTPQDLSPSPPPRPRKSPDPSFQSSDAILNGQSFAPSHDLHSQDYTFKSSAYLENGTALRTLFLPPTLRSQFLSIAAANTRANLETCGILCGTLISNALFISKLVIPEQESTSDTCETVNESALFDYCDSEDLMVLGWIHTHPSQTCFMSSRDLHTHCGYQVMMPESIAVVCAPSKQPSWGIFRLTDPPGMKSVLNCTQTGLFHPHAESNVYTDALRPGHVCEAEGLAFEIVDLRPGYH